MAKYFASEVACPAADEATRILGACTVIPWSMHVQRFYRDCRFLLFGGNLRDFADNYFTRVRGVLIRPAQARTVALKPTLPSMATAGSPTRSAPGSRFSSDGEDLSAAKVGYGTIIKSIALKRSLRHQAFP